MTFKTVLACAITVAPAALIVSQPVYAQDTPAAEPANADGSQDDSSQIVDIIVTAQRRGENSQKVPIAVTAIGGEQLKSRLVDTSALQALVPGLTWSRSINAGLPRLRGIGTSNAAPGDESSIAIYVDDVYRPATAGNVTGFNNIERIEVLKGPQGTLFGRNASGGVINIITRTPSQTPEFDANVGYAKYDTVTAGLYATGGLTSNLAADLAVDFRNQGDGWGRNLTTGDKALFTNTLGVRSKFFLDLPTTQITLSADYDRTLTDVGSAVLSYPGARLVDGRTSTDGFYDVRQNFPSFGRSEQYGGSLKVKQDIGFADLISITAYRRTNQRVRYDQDGTSISIVNFSASVYDKAFSQELQLQGSNGGRFTWILGGFYFHDTAAYDPLQVTGAGIAGTGPVPVVLSQRTRKSTVNSYSGFGQASYEIFDATKLTLGARYTVDERNLVSQNNSTFADGTFVAGPVLTDQARFPKFTYKASLDHQFTSTVLAYASLSRGFKGGVYDLVSGLPNPVQPEVVDAYEVGLKTDLFDRRVRFNLSAFYNDISNLQTNAFVTGVGQILLNAGKARTKGIDGELEIAATSNLRLRANAAYLDAHFISYPGAPFFMPRPAPAGGNITLPAADSDASGNVIPRSPKFAFTVGANYKVESEVGTFVLDASLSHSSKYFWDAQNRVTQPSTDLVSSSLAWTSPNEKWDVRFWATNLLNEKYYANETSSGIGDLVSPAEPRTYGVTVGVHIK